MPIDIAELTAADFEPQLESNFHILLPGGELELRLVEVRRLGKAMREGGAFSLTFISPPGPFLPQAIYPLTHPGAEGRRQQLRGCLHLRLRRARIIASVQPTRNGFMV